MVVMPLLYPEKENAMVSTYKYIEELVTKDVLRKLLMMENNQGLRPIEHASNVAAFWLFKAVIETEGTH